MEGMKAEIQTAMPIHTVGLFLPVAAVLLEQCVTVQACSLRMSPHNVVSGGGTFTRLYSAPAQWHHSALEDLYVSQGGLQALRRGGATAQSAAWARRALYAGTVQKIGVAVEWMGLVTSAILEQCNLY